MEFIPTLFGVICLLLIGYLCGTSAAVDEAEQPVLLTNSEDDQYFCPKEVVCQAIRVSDGYFPGWVMQTGAEIVIAPSPRITLQQGNIYVRATAADYLLKLQDGTILAVPVEQFESLYQAVNPV